MGKITYKSSAGEVQSKYNAWAVNGKCSSFICFHTIKTMKGSALNWQKMYDHAFAALFDKEVAIHIACSYSLIRFNYGIWVLEYLNYKKSKYFNN